jgi:hypothetical protein
VAPSRPRETHIPFVRFTQDSAWSPRAGPRRQLHHLAESNGEGATLVGDDIKLDDFSTTLSSGHTGATCVDGTGDRMKVTNVKCGASRDMGIVVRMRRRVVLHRCRHHPQADQEGLRVDLLDGVTYAVPKR